MRKIVQKETVRKAYMAVLSAIITIASIFIIGSMFTNPQKDCNAMPSLFQEEPLGVQVIHTVWFIYDDSDTIKVIYHL